MSCHAAASPTLDGCHVIELYYHSSGQKKVQQDGHKIIFHATKMINNSWLLHWFSPLL